MDEENKESEVSSESPETTGSEPVAQVGETTGTEHVTESETPSQETPTETVDDTSETSVEA